jgi:hypothetical protein
MSWQAQTAVNHHSKIRNVDHRRLLTFLAEHADETGNIDPSPNQDTMAAFMETTARTIRTYLNNLKRSGELQQTRVGSGPGNPSAYQILLTMPGKGGRKAEDDDKGGRKAEENSDFLSALQQLKVEIKAEISELKAEISELKAEISELKAEKVEAKGGKGGSERRIAHSFKNADDPDSDPTLDPEDIYIPPEPDLIAQTKTAVAAISKETHWPKTEQLFTDAAYELIGRDADPEQIAAFGVWWSSNGWHNGKPALSNILDHWEDFKAGRSLRKPGKSGQKQSDDINSQFDFSTMTDKGW